MVKSTGGVKGRLEAKPVDGTGVGRPLIIFSGSINTTCAI
ncbi:MAG: hypothetical protein OP8BY_0853 [Candidatus Saccharicenans subterraneus]|uniref:Uncharacterized protein n=1 Tax=Candidatus Saccharicenans subterraneus TaxID=2508984 RepID=A0A3E2BQD3_9BACT|nr:MAG: hypothetical protein OP8BY_0853 [Candidatus Saccharicenans subterraneum]